MISQQHIYDTALPVGSPIDFDRDTLFEAINNLSVIAWIASPDAQSFWFNQAWYDYSGVTPEKMQDWAWQDYFHHVEIGRVADSFYSAIENGDPWEEIFSLRRYDGVYCWFLSRANPVYDQNGNIRYWIGCDTDVSDYLKVTVKRACRYKHSNKLMKAISESRLFEHSSLFLLFLGSLGF